MNVSKFFLNYDKPLKVGPGVLKACLQRPQVRNLELLLEHDPDLQFTEDAVLDISEPQFYGEDCVDEVTGLLIKHDKKLVFTPEIRKAIEKRFQKKLEGDFKQLFLSLEKTDPSEQVQ